MPTGDKDIFNKNIVPPKKAKVLSPTDIIVIASSSWDLDTAIANKNVDEYLIQSFSYQYGMPSTVLREIGSDNQYIANMPPQGSITLSKIVGIKPITQLLSTSMLDHRYPGGILIIKPRQDVYEAVVINESGEEETYSIGYNLYFYGVRAEGIAGGADASAPAIQETATLRFTGMQYITLEQ